MNFPQPGFPAAPAFGAAPVAPQAAPAPAVTVWVHVNGQSVEVDLNTARTYPPTTPAMRGDQVGGWATLGQILQAYGPAAAPAPAPAPAAPAHPAPFAGVPATTPFAGAAPAPGAFPAAAPFTGAPAPHAAPGPFPGQQPAPAGFHGQAPHGAPAAFQPPPNVRQQVSAPAGLFSGASNASANRSGANLEEGDYVVRYVGAEFKQGTGQNSNKQWVIHEVDIVQSSFIAGDPTRSKCNQAGSRVSIFVTKNQSFDSNMKEIALALMPLDAQGQRRQDNAYISEQEFNAMLQDPCPLAGKLCYLEARKKPTRGQNGGPPGEFTRIQWFHIPVDAQGNPDPQRMLSEGWR